MSSGGRRPGGLTALAVINFVLFAWGCLEVTSVGMAAYAKNTYPDGPTPDMAIDSMEHRVASIAVEPGIRDLTMDHLVVLAILASLVSVLLLVSGIGYLLQHRVVGYVMGSVYAAGSIGSKMFSFLVISPEFHIGGVLVLVYPVLTLYLLNATFREDFVRGGPRAPGGTLPPQAKPPTSWQPSAPGALAELDGTPSPVAKRPIPSGATTVDSSPADSSSTGPGTQ